MIRIMYQENGEQKDVTGKVILGTVVVVAGAIGVGYLFHKFGAKKTYDKGFADGFFDATAIIHDSIVDTSVCRKRIMCQEFNKYWIQNQKSAYEMIKEFVDEQGIKLKEEKFK